MNQESLIRYITGDATPEEKASMAEWLDADPENMREFLAFRKLFDITLWQSVNAASQLTTTTKSINTFNVRSL